MLANDQCSNVPVGSTAVRSVASTFATVVANGLPCVGSGRTFFYGCDFGFLYIRGCEWKDDASVLCISRPERVDWFVWEFWFFASEALAGVGGSRETCWPLAANKGGIGRVHPPNCAGYNDTTASLVPARDLGEIVC